MAEPEPKEEILVKLDGVKTSVEALPDSLKEDVQRRIKEARELYAAKYPKGRLRLNINVKVKTSKEALKAAGGKPAAAPVVVVEEGGGSWAVVLVVLLALLGGAYLFVPAVSTGIDRAVESLRRPKAPASVAPPASAPAAR